MRVLESTCVFLHAYTQTVYLGSDPLPPQALNVWLHKALQCVCVCVCVFGFLCSCAAGKMIAAVSGIMDTTIVLGRNTDIVPPWLVLGYITLI